MQKAVRSGLIVSTRLHDSTYTPAKPKSPIFVFCATVVALLRESSYATLPPFSIGRRALHFTPVGLVAIILANLVTVLLLCFYKLDTTDQWEWETVGYRTGFITIAQLPLVFLLAGRRNIIGYLTGMSYERLNWFHRWVSRTLWLTATIHMGFWFRNWGQYDYIVYQLYNDALAKRGFAAWCILTFIVISSAAPVRRISYEFFVIQHLVTFVGFIVAVWLHAPPEVKAWVWVSIGLLVFDRVARYAYATYANLSIFHRASSKHPLWANRASFTSLPGNVTRITIESPGIQWEPGQHVFLTCHSIAPLQCHPFTISSLPCDNKMEFLVRAEKGATRRFYDYASKNDNILGSCEAASPSSKQERTLFIDGPYGLHRPLRQFDSVILLAGGMGVTFTIPCLRDIVDGWKRESQQQNTGKRHAVAKRIHFVWAIKAYTQLSWFETQLQTLLEDVDECRRLQPDILREVDITIYVTCNEALEDTISTACPQAQPQGVSSSAPVAEPDEKNLKPANTNVTARHSPSSLSPNGDSQTQGVSVSGCCCANHIENENAITSKNNMCTCSGNAPAAATNTQNQHKEESHRTTIKTLSGRPHSRNIIRNVLERAEGESAVVVCGPRGLSDDVRRSVVALSDERAVHKGTGAQGIYLHVEGFGW